MKFTTIRTVFAIAVSQQLLVHQVDVNTAFLYAPVEEEIYMKQPQGFVSPDGRDLVLKLNKSIYGLKQSPRNWYNTLSDFLIKQDGFHQLRTDPGAFISTDKDGGINCILLVYVDDMIIACKRNDQLTSLKQRIGAKFDIKDLQECAWLLGVAVEQGSDSITIHQKKFITELTERYNMANAAPAWSPSAVSQASATDSQPLEDYTVYQSLVGSLLYVMIATRPDIAESVSRLCRHMAAPTAAHWKAAKRVLAYLSHTSTHGITFRRGPLVPSGSTDADWAGDVGSRNSTTGYVFQINGACISWKSQLQKSVALSTAEAEYMALAAAAQDAIYLRQLLTEMGVPQHAPTVIGEDNQACIAMATNAVTSSRAKHIDIRYHFMRDLINSGEIILKYVPTSDMIADMLTKALSQDVFTHLRKLMMGN